MIDQEDLVLLRLYCCNCDAQNCSDGKIWNYTDSKCGCNRKITEENMARYIHYVEEVIPYWNQYSEDWVNKSYFEIQDFLQNNIYNQPIAAKFDHKGDVTTNV